MRTPESIALRYTVTGDIEKLAIPELANILNRDVETGIKRGLTLIEPALIDANWSDFEFRVALEQSLIANLEAESRWAMREGLVPRGPLPDYLPMFRPAALRVVDRRAVSIVK